MNLYHIKLFLLFLCSIPCLAMHNKNCITFRSVTWPEKDRCGRKENREIASVIVNEDKYLILISDYYYKARILNLETGNILTLSDKSPIYEVKIVGNKIISRGIDVKVWNLEDGSLLHVLDASPHIVPNELSKYADKDNYVYGIERQACCAFEVVGDKVITCHYNYALIWDLNDGKLLKVLFHEGLVCKIIVAGNKIITLACKWIETWNRYVRIADRDTAKIWNFEGDCLATLEHDDDIHLIAADEHLVVAQSRSNTLKVWNLNNGRLLSSIHDIYPASISLKILDGTIISQSFHLNEAAIWNTHTGKTFGQRASGGVPIALAKDRVVTAIGNDALIYDLNDGTRAQTLVGHQDRICAITVAGNKVFTGSCDHTIKIWDLYCGMLLHTLPGYDSPAREKVRSVERVWRVASPIKVADNKIITLESNGTVKIWEDARPGASFAAAQQEIVALAAAMHPRCGEKSPARLLSSNVIQEISKFVFSEPWAPSPIPLRIRVIKDRDQSCSIC